MTVAEPMLFCLRVRYVKRGRLRHLDRVLIGVAGGHVVCLRMVRPCP